MKFWSFNYLGADMDIDFHFDQVIITVNSIGDFALVLKRNDSYAGEQQMTAGSVLNTLQKHPM